ncbi:hypothetical protein F4808DRAFT_175986 [Astrocystis sublimbata]|nr:hypothetical protein F4808DRAFT_175986 [Astrocystis sublimbata]
MKPARYSVSRQKACQQCAISKAKCDRIEAGCSRCIQRGLCCVNVQPDSYSGVQQSSASNEPVRRVNETVGVGLGPTGSIRSSAQLNLERGVASSSEPTTDFDLLSDSQRLATVTAHRAVGHEIRDFVDLKLACPINAEHIGNRWLGAYIPLPDQKPKEYPDAIKPFLHGMVKSYVTAAIRGRGYPPFIHAAQVATHLIRSPLSTCLSIVRICEHQLPGSEATAINVLEREMNSLHEQYESYDTITLLCAFQAYLLFTMVLFFRFAELASPALRQSMVNLQEIACASAKRGLVCEAEQQLVRPRWESWVVAEANRRTLYTMYLFDGVLSAHDGLPTFVGTELKGLPAPSGQALWRAQTRLDWDTSYNLHLADWSEGIFQIDELWRIPEGMDGTTVAKRQSRVDRWLEGVDEFGTMLYAVTSTTHG